MCVFLTFSARVIDLSALRAMLTPTDDGSQKKKKKGPPVIEVQIGVTFKPVQNLIVAES